MRQPSTDKFVSYLGDIAMLSQERLICFTLGNSGRILRRHEVFKGTRSGCPAHPQEIFKEAVLDGAAGIVIAHNHPSGLAKPSQNDISVTQRLIAAARIMDIPLVDHIIIGGGKKYYSFLADGLMDDFPTQKLLEYLDEKC